jgi:aminoglycoside 6'-N-acetyltransferase-1b/aminoglycoside 6'-N-acetyltransferase-2
VPGDSDDILTPDTSHLAPPVTFRPLAEADLPLVHAWLNNPEVARWYGLDLENHTRPTLEQVVEHYMPRILRQRPTLCFLIMSGDRPAGFIQAYRVGDYQEYARAVDYDDDAWAIDLFIGEDDCRGGGFGSRALGLFLEAEVFSRPGVDTAVISPNPDNKRAIRAYEKAGFRHLKTVWMPPEKAYEYVMALEKGQGSRVKGQGNITPDS